MAALLFLPAWTLDYWQAWAFLAVFGASALAITLYLMKHDPKLLERRVHAGPTAEKETSQKIIQSITYWGTADLVEGNGPQRGYFVDEHANGDRDIGTFEGKVKTAGGQVTIEGTWKYSDGTGQFKGLTGGGTYKGRMTSPTEVENTWEGTYELAARVRAA